MATSSRLFTRQAQRMYYCIQRQYSNKSSSYASTSRTVSPVTTSICGIGVVAATGYWLYNEKKSLLLAMAPTVQAQTREIPRKDASDETEDLSLYPISDKEYRFQSFASCEYNGQIYMTPQDFLESVTEGNPRPRIGRFKLTEAQVQTMLKNTPSRKKSTKNLFRSIMDKGIVSYTEYLFLLCILTKPRAGYEIAFKMFDRDGNHRIDRKEFLLMEEIFRKKSQSSGESDSVSWLSQYATDPDSPASCDFKPGEVPLTDYMNSPVWDQLKINETTLLRYFFGPNGTDTLDYKTFAMFMDNLQTEVLELEFYEFSRGMPSIGEAEFANILLRYTHLEDAELEEYVERVRERMPEEKGISFESFTEFFQFINHLDDFEIVLRLYTFADQPITQAEFCRAVNVTTGQNLDEHIVHTVFQIFDKDGDGKLSQKEFLGVMKNRIHRGFREHLKKPAGWEGFKACVRKELKHNS